MRTLLLRLLLVLVSYGCGEKPSPPPGGGLDQSKDQKKGRSKKGGSGSPGNLEDMIGSDASFFRAKYGIGIRAVGVDACDGEVIFRLKAAVGKALDGGATGLFEIQDGLVVCPGLGSFNLKEMLGSTQIQPSTSPEGDHKLETSEHVVSLSTFGQSSYNPPRPLMPTFLSTEEAALKTLNVKRSVTLTDLESAKTSQGDVQIETVSFGPYKPKHLERTFQKVLHFRISNQGFQDVDKVKNMLFDSLEFHMSLDPIALLKIDFKGKAADYSGEIEKAKGGEGKAGPDFKGFGGVIKAVGRILQVRLQVDLMDQENLNEAETTNTEVVQGPIIGS